MLRGRSRNIEYALTVLAHVASSELEAMVQAQLSIPRPDLPLNRTDVGSAIVAMGYDIPSSHDDVQDLSSSVSAYLRGFLTVKC
jgi:hypothetical protein